MSAFSFTAPSISKEQEEQETTQLTESEKVILHSDLYGSTVITTSEDEDGGMANHNAGSLEEKIRETRLELDELAEFDKKEYVEALQRCPQLVESESDPARFLRAEDFDPKLAAKRIASYWKMRKNIFGEDKAFLPITLDDSEGTALSEDEVQYLEETGDYGPCTTFLLPNDVHGRTVIFLDSSKWSAEANPVPRENMVRVFWYMVHSALLEQEDNGSRMLGKFVLVVNARITSVQQFDRMYSKMQYNSIRKALPMHVCAIHACEASSVMTSLVLPCVKFIMGRDLRLRCRVHEDQTTSSKDTSNSSVAADVIAALEEYGMEGKNLPVSLGGGFTFKGKEWCDDQRAREQGGDVRNGLNGEDDDDASQQLTNAIDSDSYWSW